MKRGKKLWSSSAIRPIHNNKKGVGEQELKGWPPKEDEKDKFVTLIASKISSEEDTWNIPPCEGHEGTRELVTGQFDSRESYQNNSFNERSPSQESGEINKPYFKEPQNTNMDQEVASNFTFKFPIKDIESEVPMKYIPL